MAVDKGSLNYKIQVTDAFSQPIAKFRADLFWRINVVSIHVPPLRRRVDDIPLLMDYFLATLAESYGVAPREVTSRVVEVFQSYSWPGNVRELHNVLERAFALGRDEKRITLDDLPRELLERCNGGEEATDDGDGQVFPTYDAMVRDHLIRVLKATGGVRVRAASILGIDRNRLARLMKKHEIEMGGSVAV